MFKKSQISILIIISLIVVIIGLLIFFANDKDLKTFIMDENKEEIYNFVKECLDTTANEGMRQIGLKSGWLYTPEQYMYANEKTFNNLVKIKDGFQDLGGINFTYWYYYDDSDKEFKLRVPSFNEPNDPYSLRSQLNRFINENLDPICLNNFAQFRERFDVEYEPRDINVSVKFKRDYIYLDMKLDLKVREKNSNKSYYFNEFHLEKFNYMKRPYYHALALIEAQNNYSYIDTRIWQMLSAYMSSRSNYLLPPTSEVKFMEFDTKTWLVEDIKNLIKKIINTNTYLIRFKNSNNPVMEVPENLKDNDLAVSLYNLYNKNYIGEIINSREIFKEYEDEFKQDSVKLNFELFYPLYLELDGSLGNVVYMPEAKLLANFIPIYWTKYETEYKITGPVLLEIKSYYDNGKEYVLNVPIEFNIRHNQPLSKNSETMEKFGEEITKALSQTKTSAESIVCDPSQRVSKPVFFNLTDPLKNTGIDDAIVMFQCKNMSECYIGKTKNGFYDTYSTYSSQKVFVNKSYFETRLPVNCYPGTLKIFKFGYKTIEIKNLDPNEESVINLGEIRMPSSKKLKVSVKKREGGGFAKDLEKYETAFIIIQNLEDEKFTKVVMANYTNNSFETLTPIDLIPGIYNIKGFLIYNHTVHIEGEEFCYDKYVVGGEECVEVDPIDLDVWFRGGFNINYNVSLSQLRNNDKIIFTLQDLGLPSTFDELSEAGSRFNDIISDKQTIEDVFNSQSIQFR